MKGMATDGLYYFNRCRRCNTIITKLQLLRSFATNGVICPCGSGMFGPTNPLWYEWLLPRVIRMTVAQLLGRLDPPPQPEVPGVAPGPANCQPVPPLSPEEIRKPEEDE